LWSPGSEPACGGEFECSNSTDDDGDGRIDLHDPGCENGQDNTESPDPPQCSNGVDDDGDSRIDLADLGCQDSDDNTESPDPPQCSNGIDDDGDSKIDLNDPGCSHSTDDSESPDPPLLDQYVPELRLDSNEGYWPDSPEVVTNNPLHATHLKKWYVGVNGTYSIANSRSNNPLTRLNLGYLRPEEGTYLSGHSVDNSDFVDPANASLLSDANLMHNLYPEYANRVYGRHHVSTNGHHYLQYWFFYANNPKKFGRHFGAHEGDWEMVQVHLLPNGMPESATYAQHDDGERCDWNKLSLTSDGRPIVYVAEGSHASYFWASPRHAVYKFGRVVAEDKAMGDKLPFITPMLQDVTNPPEWLRWPGQWGGSSRSPEGPPHQGKWQEPVPFEIGARPCSVPFP
jgi:hypothetical protein